MSLPESLANDLTARPLDHPDARAVHEVMAEQERADLGTVEIEEADIVGDWQRPSFDVGSSTVGVFDGGRLVAYAETSGSGRGDAAVLPAYRGRGIGTWLAGWMQRTARAHGETVVGMPVPEGSPGDVLLASLGYHVRWTSWVLRLPVGAAVAERPLPAGFAVRAATPAEHAAVHTVVEDAFLEWSQRERDTYEDFAATSVERPGFEPWHLRVVVDEDGAVGGAALLQLADGEEGVDAWIAKLAVRRDLRRRGLAQALMVDAFAVAREHGATSSCLSTDSRTGALDLYLGVGMEVTSTWVNRAVDLT